MKKTNQKGRFIVIDGIDGSGKATQVELLVKRLKKEGYNVATIDFPQYYNNFFGKMTGRFQNGDFGNAPETSSYLASVLYAADRWETKSKIEKWLKEGKVVILDRYVSSNQIHQGGKIKNAKERKLFLEWLEEMEFEVFKIPRPELIVFLNVPYSISKKLLETKNARDYLKNAKNDQVEKSRNYQEASHKQSLKLIKEHNNWIEINCVEDNKMLNTEDINDLIWEEVKAFINKKR
ncbi:MAG: dTMP kinase [Candidatus Pacebacteria bacterium]|nr:dTMP kinase [Candidatus Paceibacterota bacterium]